MNKIGVMICAGAITLAMHSVAAVVVLETNKPVAMDTEATIHEQIKIRLQQAVFDPLQSMPKLPENLSQRTSASTGSSYYIVQFHGPIRQEWRTEIERRGGQIMDYIPDYAYLIRMDPNTRSGLSNWSAVRWHGEYPPAFQIASALDRQMQAMSAAEHLEVMARAFPGEPSDVLVSKLNQAGVHIIEYGQDSADGTVFRLSSNKDALVKLARIPELAWIEPFHKPELANEIVRSNTIVRKNLVEQQLNLYGEGQIVAVVDSGLSTGDPVTMHLDFIGRVAGWGWAQGGSCSGWEDNNSHGTHVAGTVLGSGVRSGANPVSNSYLGSNAGIAPKAELVVWSNCEDFSGVPFSDMYNLLWKQLYNFDENLRVSNNSWSQNDSQGQYNIIARETDRFLWDHQDMVIVFAAGNSGVDSDADGESDLGTVLAPATAKNVLTVGASENFRLSGGLNPGAGCSTYGDCYGDFPAPPISNDRVSDNSNGMVAYSGRGPTLGNRLKPDIVAPGSNIVSARNESTGTGDGVYDNYYLYMGETSMAAPAVSGGAAIVREYFQKQLNHDPSAALVKAALINGGFNMAPGQYGDVWAWPDINQGWGRMDLARSLYFSDGRHPLYFEGQPGLQTGQGIQGVFTVAESGKPLRITLTWTDAPGAEASHGSLVNDLDLEVKLPNGDTLFGFGGLSGQPRDRWNVAEAVGIQQAPAGNYTVSVIGYNVPVGPQPFALVITGALDVPSDEIFSSRFEAP